MNYLLVLCLVVVFFMVKICGSTSLKECRFPLLSNYDDMIANVTADTVDNAASVTPKLYEGWCRRDHKGSAVQVYFAMEVAITGMVIRGHSNRWVEKFSLQYSNDGSTWVYYNEDGEESEPMYLTGNTDAETNNLFWFKFTVRAQYLRIIPYPYEGGTHGGGGKPCFRFELFGCDNDLWNSIGLTEGKIGATLLITSGYARLRFRWNITSIYKGTDSANGWCPLKNDQTNKEPLIILLEAVHLITGFAILKCSSLTCVPKIVTFTMRTWSKRDIEDRPSQQAVSKDGDTAFHLRDATEGENKNAFLYVFKKAVSGTVIFMNFYSKRCLNIDYSFCIQLELYGKQLECLSALGVESSYLHPNGAIKNTQMTASSSHPDHPAYFGRREHFSAWCANPVMLKDPVVARSQYLQIDFIKLKNISAISTQGLDADNYVKAYHVYYAVDGVDFRSLRHEERNVKELLETCPDFGKRQQFNYLSKTILARYLRINPQRWLNNMCMRLEVFGCDAGGSPLGMQFGMIANEQIKASSETKANPKKFGRLNSAGWCANVEAEALNDKTKTQYHYLQVDLLQPNVICGVATQGIRANEGNQQPEAVTSFYLRYSLTGVEWLRHHRLLTGEYHGNEVVYHWLDPPLVTRFIQFNPQSSRSPLHVCIRAEIYSCRRDERSDYLPLGMESLRISDLQLSASSQSDSSTSAKYSRLNHYIQGGAWIPAESNPTEYLQIDLAWITILTGIATQGHPEKPHRVLTYRLRHRISPDESLVEYNKEFEGNTLEGSTMIAALKHIRCRYLRVYPLTWSGQVALRVELFGYEAEYCCDRLRVVSSSGNSTFNASSHESFSLAEYGRLHSGLGSGAWCALTQDKNQYLQVDLSDKAVLTGFATQGQKYFDNWVSTFTLAYSQDKQLWDDYSVDADSEMVFLGNKDRHTAVLHFFSVPIIAHFVRFRPRTWMNKICMRVEIYGCAPDVSFCVNCSSHASCVVDVLGTETCVCNPEYSGDGRTCQDRDECQSKNKPCPESKYCLNINGYYECSCKEGYIEEGSNCSDIDECEDSDICPTPTNCINTPGSFVCDCGQGFSYHSASRSCKDIDECSTDSHACTSRANCVNTDGSYSCVCKEGYTGHGKVHCVDVNECNQVSHACPSHGLCENTEGSYFCACQAGFILKDDLCEDVDECASDTGLCHWHADCANTVGSYKCNCRPGFISNGPHCIDYNECLGNHHNCDVNALCANIAGSYNCFCKQGYTGDGFKCEKEGG